MMVSSQAISSGSQIGIPVVVGLQLSLVPLLILIGHGYVSRLLLFIGFLPHLTHLFRGMPVASRES